MMSIFIILFSVIILLIIYYFSLKIKSISSHQSIIKHFDKKDLTHNDGILIKDFIKNMIPHHQTAIDKSLVIYKFSDSPYIRYTARRIILSQDYDVWTLWNFFHPLYYRYWYVHGSDDEFDDIYNKMREQKMRISQMEKDEMIRNIKVAYPTQLELRNEDQEYVKWMINHHMMALEMCKNFEKNINSTDSDFEYVNNLLGICYSIKKEQELELLILKDLIDPRYLKNHL
jgi:uncharacterized protein (DUF305 family)